MHGNVTNEEWQIFKEAYQYFSDHCLPPANQDENAVDWWMSAAQRKKEKAMQSKEIRNRKREAYYSTLTWVKAWPRPIVTNTIGMGGHE